ncbi:hypothetical protein U9M48_043644 [Paspalum notatum var. saurae]|uniref:F-box domain-containing protein n=1 Tax=Paspalum notatum var. saurae TaxID=547442 RepID=A0AAQ3UTE4_PASNO
MAGDDLLSALGDDILQRILHFVPTKEAASISVLSHRWGSLWRSSGAVNLAVHLHIDKSSDDDYHSFARAARTALDAADAPVTRLTVRLQADGGGAIYNFLHHPKKSRRRIKTIDVLTPRDVVGDLVSHPAPTKNIKNP